MGSAACAWDDFAAAEALLAQAGRRWDMIVAANSIGVECPQLDIWVTLHPELLAEWQAARDAKPEYSPVGRVIAHRQFATGERPARLDEVHEYRWPDQTRTGSSGLFAVKVTMDTGVKRIILCGVPMTPSIHRDDGKPWVHYNSFTSAWTDMLWRISPTTRSMSGWTRQILGHPEFEWLQN